MGVYVDETVWFFIFERRAKVDAGSATLVASANDLPDRPTVVAPTIFLAPEIEMFRTMLFLNRMYVLLYSWRISYFNMYSHCNFSDMLKRLQHCTSHSHLGQFNKAEKSYIKFSRDACRKSTLCGKNVGLSATTSSIILQASRERRH